MNSSKLIAIIPARGGSKRIPRKNIKLFHGKPIITYSIKAALKSGLFNDVIVSTDDEEIAEIAIKYGAKVPFYRSKKNSDDFATTFDVLEEVYQYYLKKGETINTICCIYPCAAFTTAEKLTLSYKLFSENNFDSLLPIIEYGFPIQRALKIEKINVAYSNPEFAMERTQDLENRYHDAGQFYWMEAQTIMNKKTILTENTGFFIISELEAHDIDTILDWKLAELKYKLMHDEIST
jgi:pseudaminic acid cytidylyltransferase